MIKRPLYILDSYAFIYRSYFAFMNRPLRNAIGANVSAAFDSSASFSPSRPTQPSAFAAVFDPKGKTFRHDMYAEYKATRQKTPRGSSRPGTLVEEILRASAFPCSVPTATRPTISSPPSRRGPAPKAGMLDSLGRQGPSPTRRAAG